MSTTSVTAATPVHNTLPTQQTKPQGQSQGVFAKAVQAYEKVTGCLKNLIQRIIAAICGFFSTAYTFVKGSFQRVFDSISRKLGNPHYAPKIDALKQANGSLSANVATLTKERDDSYQANQALNALANTLNGRNVQLNLTLQERTRERDGFQTQRDDLQRRVAELTPPPPAAGGGYFPRGWW